MLRDLYIETAIEAIPHQPEYLGKSHVCGGRRQRRDVGKQRHDIICSEQASAKDHQASSKIRQNSLLPDLREVYRLPYMSLTHCANRGNRRSRQRWLRRQEGNILYCFYRRLVI